jgi:fibronectin-binding autotransporter adhesin
VGVDTNTGSLPGNVTLGDPSAILDFDRSNAYTYAGSISGSGSVEQTGYGVTTLTGKNSYSGGTTVTNGVLAFTSVGALGTGPVTVFGGLFSAFGPELLGSGNLTLNNLVSVTDPLSTPVISATKGSTLVLNHLEIDGQSVGFGAGGGGTGTVVIGPGTTLSSNYCTIFVTGGTLQNGGGLGALASHSSFVLSSGATLALKDMSITLGLAGSGSVNLGTNSATVLTLDGPEFGGTISGAGHVNANGNGYFLNANTYSGGTTVTQNATLVTYNTSGSATGTGPVTIDDGGVIGGHGTVSGEMTLNGGAIVEPGVNSLGLAGTRFHGSSLLWNGGGTLKFQIGSTSDELLLSGSLTKGTTGAFDLDILDAGISPGTYTLVTFASTTFAPADFTLQFPDALPAGDNASLSETGKSLVLTITHSQLPARFDSPASSETGGELATGGTLLSGVGATDASNMTSLGTNLTPAPEPASALLLGIGSCALLGWRRRRCRSI